MRKESYPNSLFKLYDEIALASNPELFKLRQKVASEIKACFQNKEVSIFEIGCGNGETTEYLLKQIKNTKITAIDINKNMVKSTKKNLKKYIDSKNLQVIHGDSFKFVKELKDSQFDCFTSSWTIHNFEKDRRSILLKEILRILKPQGLFITMDKYYPESKEETEKYFEFVLKAYQKIKEKNIKLYNELIEHEKEDLGENYIQKEKETIEIMKSIGYKNPKVIKRILRESILIATK